MCPAPGPGPDWELLGWAGQGRGTVPAARTESGRRTEAGGGFAET